MFNLEGVFAQIVTSIQDLLLNGILQFLTSLLSGVLPQG